MCGIAGIVGQKGNNYTEAIGKMNLSLRHRGPDMQRSFAFDCCTLGHTRLSIIDLSTGDQPMITPGRAIGIVFNGEIYGYKKLRDSLEYKFSTNSDTEVIIALYGKYGKENFLSHLPGMFAFALWDDKRKTLVCARDRFGEKPFYYAIGKNGEFIFASEIKAILSSGFIEPVLDKESVSYYLKHLYVHPKKTIYKNIFTLPPAHFLEFREGKVFMERYWNIPETQHHIELSDAISEFKRLLNESVEKQLVADVPVGAFLSGGLDSSTIVAIASQLKPGIKTFSFGFRDSINELPFAKEIVKKYNTDHIELWDDNEDIAALLMKMQEVYDEPFGDSSNIPTYLISKLSKKYTTVALTGDGGDELLGGYGWYRPFLSNKKTALDPLLKTKIAHLAGRISRRLGNNSTYEKVIGARTRSFPSMMHAHTQGRETVFSNESLKKFGLPIVDEYILSESTWRKDGSVNDAMRVDIENYMPGDILVKTDRAAMANSLELRAPFLDISLASFCLSLPYSFKIKDGSDKYILRKAYEDSWTESIRKRKKHGFGAPVGKWLREESMLELKRSYLFNKNKKIYSLISSREVESVDLMNNYQTWALLVLSLWMERNNFTMQ